ACGSGARAGQGAAAPPPAARSSMLTSLSAGHGAASAGVEGGGSRAAHNNFWQLLVRPAAGQAWRLATPPGVADNGGLVATAPGGYGSTAGPGSNSGTGNGGTARSRRIGLLAARPRAVTGT